MIVLQIQLKAKLNQGPALEQICRETYFPTVSRQVGFLGSSLLRAFAMEDRYQITISFESEQLRKAWAASSDHEETWPKVEALCDDISPQGWDVLA